jgi:hypothetical protein
MRHGPRTTIAYIASQMGKKISLNNKSLLIAAHSIITGPEDVRIGLSLGFLIGGRSWFADGNDEAYCLGGRTGTGIEPLQAGMRADGGYVGFDPTRLNSKGCYVSHTATGYDGVRDALAVIPKDIPEMLKMKRRRVTVVVLQTGRSAAGILGEVGPSARSRGGWSGELSLGFWEALGEVDTSKIGRGKKRPSVRNGLNVAMYWQREPPVHLQRIMRLYRG